MKNKNKKGFTLIETMIAVSILGIVSAFAIPAYQDYVIKSQVSEAFVAADALKKEVESQKALTNKFNINLVKIDSSSMRVDDEGNVFYTFKDKNKNIDDKLVMFYLDENNSKNNVFKWNCISDLDKKYLPSSVECFIDDEKTDNSSSEEDAKNEYDDEILFSIGDGSFGSGYNHLYLHSISKNESLIINHENNSISFTSKSNPNLNFNYNFKSKDDLIDVLFNNKIISDENGQKKSLKGFVSNLQPGSFASFNPRLNFAKNFKDAFDVYVSENIK